MTKLQKILIVDASRVVRTSLLRDLKGHFEVCEDADGESAWQTLVLDSSIVAVISGSKLARLDGLGLVERMRENRLCRLNRLPFFLLVSDSFSLDERRCASLCGVSGFIPKGMAGPETVALLLRFIAQLPLVQSRQAAAAVPGDAEAAEASERSIIGTTDIMGQVGRLANAPDGPPDESPSPRTERVFLNSAGIEQRLHELLPQADQPTPVGLLIFALDGYADLVSRYGGELAWRVVQKISALLADKIRGDDSIGHLAPGQVAIIAPLTDSALCTRFSLRVCQALAAAQISLRGQRVGMSVSVGIAVHSGDGAALGAADLLRLARDRVEAAMRTGGSRVVASDDGVALAAINPQEFLGRLRELLGATAPEVMAPCLAEVGMQILPILKQIEQTFHFGLPVDDMQRRLGELASSEK